MIKKLALTTVALLMPTLACAGLVNIYVGTGSSSGKVADGLKGGYKTTAILANFSSVDGYELSKVTINGAVKVTTPRVGHETTQRTLSVPWSSSTQTVTAYFTQTAAALTQTSVMTASCPTAVNVVSDAAGTAFSGGTSTVKYAVAPTFEFTGPAGITFTPATGSAANPISIATVITASAAAGPYTGTLTLKDGAVVKSTKTFTINVSGAGAAGSNLCLGCHTGWTQATAYATSAHANNTHSTCEACHNNSGAIAHPYDVNEGTVNKSTFVTLANISAASGKLATGAIFCTACHNGTYAIPHATTGLNFSCNVCHTSTTGVGGAGDAHSVKSLSCVGCHSVAQAAPFAGDNTGVRSITNEFGKWSHHVTGVTLNDAHCAACHLEGKVDSHGNIAVDGAKHMVGSITNLRNADTDADLQWDPAAPSHSTMDTFCMSCHDSNGATSAGSVAIQAYINTNGIAAAGKTASATNPFGDTISNDYDLMERPAVVDAKGQFATGNNSHHAVLGKKYTGRTRGDGIAARTVDTVAFAANSSATLPGKRSTIFDAGRFQDDYTTLADAAGETDVPGSLNGRNGGTDLGDDSTLHCGDCHTVGQYSATQADYNTRYNKAVIGAHGSNNEYMLRNNIGTDARHQGAETEVLGGNVTMGYGTKPYLVCFNCHAFNVYGTVTSNNGETGINHAGEYAKDERCNGPFNTIFGNMTGEHRLRSMGTATTVTTSTGYGQWVGGGKYFGNMFGIQCANCHNSGVKGNIFGGIHGSKVQTYTDGMGNTSKHIHFLPGLGNAMFVPGVKGGFTGGTLATYKAYSGNRNGTGTGNSLGQTWTLLPSRGIKVTVGPEKQNANGSYDYITGGVSNDLNWEQRTQQPIAGETDLPSKAMGCYTVSPDAPNYTYSGTGAFPWKTTAGSAPTGQQKNPKVLALQAGGYPADDIRNAASTGLTAGDGREVFDVWGGCDDHNGAQGAGTGIVRKVLRKVSY